MTNLTLRNTKLAPLTHQELDDNFSNLNTDKAPLNNPVFTGSVRVNGPIALSSPTTVTAAVYSIAPSDSYVRFENPCTVTLPVASEHSGRILRVSSSGAFAVTSASSNVVQKTTGSTSTAILTAVAGEWVDLQSNGTSWYITAGSGAQLTEQEVVATRNLVSGADVQFDGNRIPVTAKRAAVSFNPLTNSASSDYITKNTGERILLAAVASAASSSEISATLPGHSVAVLPAAAGAGFRTSPVPEGVIKITSLSASSGGIIAIKGQHGRSLY